MTSWAILGTGFISNTVVEAIGASSGSRVQIVAGRNQERVSDFADRHSIPEGCVGYDTAIRHPGVDAVYIGTPNHQHHELAITAARAGKAVLSEKSLTTTMATAHELVDGVRDRVFFVEGLMYLAHPLYATFVEWLGSERIGRVQAVHGRYAADIAAVVNPEGRGTIYNLGCYPVSLLQLVIQTTLGDDGFAHRSMTASGTRTSDNTIGAATATIRFGNGVLATLASTDNYGMAHAFSVLTDRGELCFETNPWLPVAGENVFTWNPYDGPTERIVVNSEHDAFVHQIQVVERAMAIGATEAQRPSPRLADSLEIMEFLTDWEELCFES